jgi:hypothetical protein
LAHGTEQMWGPERARTSLRRVAVQVQIAAGTCCGRSSAFERAIRYLFLLIPALRGPPRGEKRARGLDRPVKIADCKKLGVYDFEMAEAAATTHAIAEAFSIATLPLLSRAAPTDAAVAVDAGFVVLVSPCGICSGL